MSFSRTDIIDRLESGAYDFDALALTIFDYQYTNNAIYRAFVDRVSDRSLIDRVERIPFLPIELFKHLDIRSGDWSAEAEFRSSGTMGQRSVHRVRSVGHYHHNAMSIFDHMVGGTSSYRYIALLPNYQANPHSSLISMVEHFISVSDHGGVFCGEDVDLFRKEITTAQKAGIATVIFGVSFALLDYSDRFSHEPLTDCIVIETGGMKRYKKEITRTEMQSKLRGCFQGAVIGSEYGMTECLSQLYALDSETFMMNDRMQIRISDPTSPGDWLPQGRKGRVNIIDLANVDTISFIATDDIGQMHDDGSVSILGRMSHSDLRGCNYLL